jgi:hypothetical protein
MYFAEWQSKDKKLPPFIQFLAGTVMAVVFLKFLMRHPPCEYVGVPHG